MPYRRKRSSEYSKRRPRASTKKRSAKKGWSSFLLPRESAKAKELKMQFKHLRSQLDFANSESEIAFLVNEGERLRRKGVKQGTPNTADEQFRLLVDKAKKRATYLGLKPYAEKLAEVLIGYAPILTSRGMRVGKAKAPASTSIVSATKAQLVEMKETKPRVFEHA